MNKAENYLNKLKNMSKSEFDNLMVGVGLVSLPVIAIIVIASVFMFGPKVLLILGVSVLLLVMAVLLGILGLTGFFILQDTFKDK